MATITIDIPMMDALSAAEALAYQHPDERVVVYRGGDRRLQFCLASQNLPSGAQVVTDMWRSSPEWPAEMAEVVAQVLRNMASGSVLAEEAVVERYPGRRPNPSNWFTGVEERGPVFCYSFMNTEGFNVATWIPDVARDGARMELGISSEGRGRPYLLPVKEKVNIKRYIERALADAASQEVASVEVAVCQDGLRQRAC